MHIKKQGHAEIHPREEALMTEPTLDGLEKMLPCVQGLLLFLFFKALLKAENN